MWTFEQSRKVAKYLTQKLGIMAAQMRRAKSNFWWFCDGSKIFMVNEMKGVTINADKHDLIGVYNNETDTNDLRDDLLWYIENILEAKQ